MAARGWTVGQGMVGAAVTVAALSLPAPAQELRELPARPDYSLVHPDRGVIGDGPPGTSGPTVPVPSGQNVWWIDTVHFEDGPQGLTYRFRFLAPQIGGSSGLSPDVALIDIAALCETYVVARIASPGPSPAQVMISLSDKVIPFGESAPEVVQFFEAFTVDDGACTWEFF